MKGILDRARGPKRLKLRQLQGIRIQQIGPAHQHSRAFTRSPGAPTAGAPGIVRVSHRLIDLIGGRVGNAPHDAAVGRSQDVDWRAARD
ncbi:hypothetical protein D3C86_1640600 [compost metagenome]